MSHSAHRRGTKEEFTKDYVVFVKPARGIDDIDEETKAETIRKTKELADIAIKYNPVNLGRSKVGCIEGGVDYHEIADTSLNGFMTVFKEKDKKAESCSNRFWNHRRRSTRTTNPCRFWIHPVQKSRALSQRKMSRSFACCQIC